MINALNKPSDEKTYADAAAQFAYRAYGFSDDQYNYIVSSIDKQFMEIRNLLHSVVIILKKNIQMMKVNGRAMLHGRMI